MPASCEACGRADLLPENAEAWELLCAYPSVIDRRGAPRVDYPAAAWVLKAEHIADRPGTMRKFEAFVNGIDHA